MLTNLEEFILCNYIFRKRRFSESDSASSLSQAERILKSKKITSPQLSQESQGRKTEIGDIILPNVIELNNLDQVTKSGSTNVKKGEESEDTEFIVFQDDNVSKDRVKSEESKCDTEQNVCVTKTEENASQWTDIVNDLKNTDECQTVGDVLMVSHGGLIKELVKFFVEKLACRMPDGFRSALRICNNCSVSKFLISVQNVDHTAPKVTCLFFNSKEHLLGLDADFFEGKYC
jgi:hypothetical protein